MPALRTRDTQSRSLEVTANAPPQLPPLTIISPTPRAFTFPTNHGLPDSPYASYPPFEPDLQELSQCPAAPFPTATPPPFQHVLFPISPAFGPPSRYSSAPHVPQTHRSSVHSIITDKVRQLHRGDDDYIKRPENAFILFRRRCCEERLAAANSGSRDAQANLSKTISQQWKSLSAEERKVWEDRAEEKRKEHEKLYPSYVYRPRRSDDRKNGEKTVKRGMKGETGCQAVLLPRGVPGRGATSVPTPSPYQLTLVPTVYQRPPHRKSRIVSNPPAADPPVVHLLDKLSDVLGSAEKRKAVWNLKGEEAQSMIDFLYSALSCPHSSAGLHKHAFVALCKLSKASNLYPQCYLLKNIKFGEIENGGGFCDIYKGHHEGQSLCLKVVRLFAKGEKDVALKALTKEAILWGHFDHPNIAPFYGVYYFDEPRKRICLVSPWMDNGNLVTYLSQNPSAPRDPFVRDVVSGLEYLHDMDVVHGDLKGMNVLVDASHRACITDFGLSTILTDKTLPFTNTTSSVFACTLRWAAPELISGSLPNRESDVWAFGCVCYEILTRKYPFYECKTDFQIMGTVFTGGLPTRPEEDGQSDLDHINDAMWNLMSRCWTQDPKERPTCKEIAQELKLEGLVGQRNEEAHDHAAQERQHFQNAMMMNGDVRVDFGRIERILEELQCNTARI